MDLDKILAESQKLNSSFLGEDTVELTNTDELRNTLELGEVVLITMLWGGVPHQIVAESLVNERVIFFNSLKTPGASVGSSIGGDDGTPLRRVEDGGMESFSFDTLRDLMASKAIKVQGFSTGNGSSSQTTELEPIEALDPLSICRVCGLGLGGFLPWGEDGVTPSYSICPCCGVEFGLEDSGLSNVLSARDFWLEQGAQWFQSEEKPPSWDKDKQMLNIPDEWTLEFHTKRFEN